jgi:hypothetical protein
MRVCHMSWQSILWHAILNCSSFWRIEEWNLSYFKVIVIVIFIFYFHRSQLCWKYIYIALTCRLCRESISKFRRSVINLNKLSKMISAFLPHECQRASPSVKVVRRLGLCITVEVFCRNCSFISSKWAFVEQTQKHYWNYPCKAL